VAVANYRFYPVVTINKEGELKVEMTLMFPFSSLRAERIHAFTHLL